MSGDLQTVPVAPERVREIRETSGCGMFVARRFAQREALLETINNASSIDDLKPILRSLVYGINH